MCGAFSKNWPPLTHIFECLAAREWNCLKGSERLKGMALLDVSLGMSFEVSKAHAGSSQSLLLDQDV